jgi:hypothetical protein
METQNASSEDARDLVESAGIIHVPRIRGVVAQVHRHAPWCGRCWPHDRPWSVDVPEDRGGDAAVNRMPLLDTYATR